MNEWNGALSKPIPTEPGESHEDTNLKKYYSLEGDIYITTQKKNQLFHKMFSVVLTTPSPGIKAKYSIFDCKIGDFYQTKSVLYMRVK